ncbi:hypothetical protein BVI1335_1650021 [Burkholderia vietnamiensis]|nr:hypothetical protein BVI1335_1650021 [Burkholderia vietnamiensis]
MHPDTVRMHEFRAGTQQGLAHRGSETDGFWAQRFRGGQRNRAPFRTILLRVAVFQAEDVWGYPRARQLQNQPSDGIEQAAGIA